MNGGDIMDITYQEFINNVLATRGRHACGDEYHERHHIIPKCMGGANDEDNLIDLYAREHFIAHKLLAQENPSNNALVFAWTCMSFPKNELQKDRYELTPEEYEEARKAISKAMTGRVVSEETKRKLSENKKGKPLSDKAIKRSVEVHQGVSFTEEHKKKISEALKGRIFSDEHKINISNAKKKQPLSDAQKNALKIVCESNNGRKHSKEAREKMSIANKGRQFSQATREKMSASHKEKRTIGQYDIDSGCLIKEWGCIADASKVLMIQASNISNCANGRRKSAGGFVWKFL